MTSSCRLAEGKMEKLDSKWILINDSQCTEKDASAATLGLTNMAGNQGDEIFHSNLAMSSQ